MQDLKVAIGTCGRCGGPILGHVFDAGFTSPFVIPLLSDPSCAYCGRTPVQRHGAILEMNETDNERSERLGPSGLRPTP